MSKCTILDSLSKSFGSDQRADLLALARTAEAAERYDDMCELMKALTEKTLAEKEQLSVEERNLLSVAYKNVIGTRRASWRTLHAEPDPSSYQSIYKNQIEVELRGTCDDVLTLLRDKLNVSSGLDGEAKVFYLKMTGDYYRYLAESVTTMGYDQQAAEYYRQAYDVAKDQLDPTHPIRLGLALNYSVCFYEILKDKKQACELAKTAFDSAISKLDQLEEADYKDSTLIMQLLRDNLTLWTASNEDEEGDQVQVEDLSDDEEH